RLQDQLDLAWVDVEAARDDQLLQPAADRERALRVELADVAGLEPAVYERFPGRPRVAPVAAEDLAALQLHLVLLPQPHLDTRERVLHPPGAARPLIGIRNDDPAFGDPVALQGRLAEQPFAAPEQLRGEGGGAAHDESDPAQV